ncbi:crotonase/enoyl-CoA hydratase family protein [Nannocystis sp. SCPEA4]|uniref:crotonase/enoyl-CoA hydratase family protein n=1 Tax=Nannocystis sp. SCPEA4 TaxID=2996787 RepID=UPI0022705EEC|nr:crotonase/enoyl-CoA hydratase family protein [Nannocystis sp. SCPEA4]MCY1054392.1 crotonase/enoyl-CoA hydratase family protein [Nannocystis sp. SCPEA4]
MSESQPRVIVSVDAGVAEVRLNRPDKRNGLDLAMFEALVAAGREVSADPRVRAVVLHGEGKAFCAGLDWSAFLAAPEVGQKLLDRGEASPANLAQLACWIWSEVQVPVIAAIHGAAIGGGLQLALACDIRIAAPDAQLAVMELKYGLIPDMSISKTLLRLVRSDIARELIYTARTVAGDEAARLGLITRVEADPLAAALALARTIAAQSPQAIRAAKALCNEAPELDIAAAFRRETALQLTLLGSENQMEAVRAHLGRRAPVFRDPE